MWKLRLAALAVVAAFISAPLAVGHDTTYHASEITCQSVVFEDNGTLSDYTGTNVYDVTAAATGDGKTLGDLTGFDNLADKGACKERFVWFANETDVKYLDAAAFHGVSNGPHGFLGANALDYNSTGFEFRVFNTSDVNLDGILEENTWWRLSQADYELRAAEHAKQCEADKQQGFAGNHTYAFTNSLTGLTHTLVIFCLTGGIDIFMYELVDPFLGTTLIEGNNIPLFMEMSLAADAGAFGYVFQYNAYQDAGLGGYCYAERIGGGGTEELHVCEFDDPWEV